MTRLHILGAILCSWTAQAVAADRHPTETVKHGPQTSGFFDFFKLQPSEVQDGVGNIGKFNCVIGSADQPSEYANNSLLDCDGEVPHNETSITVDPGNVDHAVGAYHSYVIQFKGATTVTHVVSVPSVTTDGGTTWREVLPPITPYQFSGDPAVTFNTRGHVFLASIADHEGPGGPYSSPSVIVQRSLDGGQSWSGPVTVARGEQAVTPNRFGFGPQVFNDKEFIAADTASASRYNDRLYVTWSRFTQFFSGTQAFFKIPIQVARSGDGVSWSAPQTISGFSSNCSVHLSGLPSQPNECDLNQDSYPTVAPRGRVYVSFENFNTAAENQILVVRSDDGGQTWTAPSKATDVFDVNFPSNVDARDTLTGCQLRYGAVANSAADPSDPTGSTVYVAFADNRNGTSTATNTDVFLAKSTDAGATWSLVAVDTAPNDQFYPWVAIGPSGTVNVGYMDRGYGNASNPGDQTICKYGFTLTRLTPGGIVISRERVDSGISHADQSRWFSSAANANTRFIGDYNGVAVDSLGGTWSLWTDHRNEIPGLSTTLVNQQRTHGQHAVGTITP